MVTSYFYPRGYGGNAVFALCRNLVKQGVDVRVLTSTIMGEPNSQNIEGIEVQRIPTHFFKMFNTEYPFSPTAFKNLISIFRKQNIDLIHVQFLYSPLSLFTGFLKSFNFNSIPLLATSHGLTKGYPDSIINAGSKLLSFFSNNLVLKNANGITTVSNIEYNVLNQKYPKKVYHIPNGVDTSTFRPLLNIGTAFRKKLGIKENEIVVLYFAHLRASKGILTLLDAMDAVIKTTPSVKFLIVGTGPQANEVKKRLLKHKKHAFPFIKYIADKELPVFYNACDIYVLPSFVEGMPLSLMEAMACGKPVISTTTSDIPLLVKTGKNGIIIPPGDSSLLADSIIELAQNPQLRMYMGQENRKKMEHHDWKKIAERYCIIYKEIIDS